MHYASVKWICFLLFVVVGKVAMAEGITSPDGNLRLEFTVNALGEPVYQLFYKEKAVVNPSKLGLELVGDPGLMNGFTLVEAGASTFDETWKPVWGEVSQIGSILSGSIIRVIGAEMPAEWWEDIKTRISEL